MVPEVAVEVAPDEAPEELPEDVPVEVPVPVLVVVPVPVEVSEAGPVEDESAELPVPSEVPSHPAMIATLAMSANARACRKKKLDTADSPAIVAVLIAPSWPGLALTPLLALISARRKYQSVALSAAVASHHEMRGRLITS